MSFIEERLHLAPLYPTQDRAGPVRRRLPVVGRRRELRHRVPCPSHRPAGAGRLASVVHPVRPAHQPAAGSEQTAVGDLRDRWSRSGEGLSARLFRHLEQGPSRRHRRCLGCRAGHRDAGPQPGRAAPDATGRRRGRASRSRPTPRCSLGRRGTTRRGRGRPSQPGPQRRPSAGRRGHPTATGGRQRHRPPPTTRFNNKVSAPPGGRRGDVRSRRDPDIAEPGSRARPSTTSCWPSRAAPCASYLQDKGELPSASLTAMCPISLRPPRRDRAPAATRWAPWWCRCTPTSLTPPAGWPPSTPAPRRRRSSRTPSAPAH